MKPKTNRLTQEMTKPQMAGLLKGSRSGAGTAGSAPGKCGGSVGSASRDVPSGGNDGVSSDGNDGVSSVMGDKSFS